MDELKKLLENAGLAEAEFPKSSLSGIDKVPAGKHISQITRGGVADDDLDWGDEMIEDLKTLINETPSGKITHEELMGVIQQYENPDLVGEAEGKPISQIKWAKGHPNQKLYNAFKQIAELAHKAQRTSNADREKRFAYTKKIEEIALGIIPSNIKFDD